MFARSSSEILPAEVTFKITAKNWGRLPLPPNFKEFKIDVYQGYVRWRDNTGGFRQKKLGTIKIPAAETAYRTATFTTTISPVNPAHKVTRVVNFVWTNDVHVKNKAGTNLAIKSIEILSNGH